MDNIGNFYETMDDLNEFIEFRKEAYKKHELTGLFFEVTSRCNARCEHCGSSCGDFIPKDEITADEIKSVLDDLAEHYDPSKIFLFITGGEPMVRKDIFDLMKYARKKGFNWGMTTNGMLIDEKAVEKMKETEMYSVSVSIDGLKDLHESFRRVPNSYEKILHGIKLMQKCPCIRRVQVTTCVNKKNIDQLEDLYKLLKENDVKEWRIINVDPIGRAKDNKDLLLDADGLKRMFQFIFDKRKILGYRFK